MSDQSYEDPTPAELRAAADRGAAAQKENERLTRELAILKAGVNVESPVGKMFLTAYDGELETSKIAEAWAQIAPAPAAVPATEPAATEPTPEVDPEAEMRAKIDAHLKAEEQRMRAELGSGGSGVTDVGSPDPTQTGYDEFHALRKQGQTRQRASKAVIDSIIGAAASGDERVIWNGWSDEELQEAGIY